MPTKTDPVKLAIWATIIESVLTFLEDLVKAIRKAVTGMTKEQVHTLIFKATMPQVHLYKATCYILTLLLLFSLLL
jgi:hypothetical protein